MTTFLYAVLLLAATGLIAAVVLYFIAMKFKVEEDPRIDLVAERLPGANCGACGKAGCRDLAKATGKPNSTARSALTKNGRPWPNSWACTRIRAKSRFRWCAVKAAT